MSLSRLASQLTAPRCSLTTPLGASRGPWRCHQSLPSRRWRRKGAACSMPAGCSTRRPHSSLAPRARPCSRRKMGLRSISKALSYTKGDRQEHSNHNIELESASKRFDSALRAQLSTWTDKLIDLQPKVYMSPHILECGLVLFKALRQRQLQAWIDGKLPKSYISNRELMRHDLVAVWWIAMKHCSVRTVVPNRALLARATDSKRSLLSECELVRCTCSLCTRRSPLSALCSLLSTSTHAYTPKNSPFASPVGALCAGMGCAADSQDIWPGRRYTRVRVRRMIDYTDASATQRNDTIKRP